MVETQVVLDTNTVIDFIKENETVIEELKQFDIFYLTATVCGELLFGAKNSGKVEENEKKYRDFISKCYILDIDLNVSDEYASARLELKKKGKPIPENDIWIAATCISNDIMLVSRDAHFENIETLKFKKLIY